MILRKRQVCTR